MLRGQLNNERATKQGLEGLLQDNHTKGWQTQMAMQEKETEIQLLKDRLALHESKMYVPFCCVKYSRSQILSKTLQ